MSPATRGARTQIEIAHRALVEWMRAGSVEEREDQMKLAVDALLLALRELAQAVDDLEGGRP